MIVIKKVIAGGKGLATLPDGLIVMVPGVLPGETVAIRETKVYRGHKEAELLQIINPAPERITPPCPYYGSCGGCDLQHAAYPAQLRIKQHILHETLVRAHLKLPEGQPGPTLPSPEPFGYRHRLRLHLDRAGQLGFHQSSSNQVVPIRRCLLATEAINRVIGRLVDNGWPNRLKDEVSALELIHCPASDRVTLVLQPLATPATAAETLLTQEYNLPADEVVIQEKKTGRTTGRKSRTVELSQEFTLLGHTYRLSWDQGCFFQVNVGQNPRMIEQALGLLPQGPHPFTALDIFCGMGNFSIPLGLMGAAVTGIEHNRHSIHWAERNSRQACLPRARFIAADVEQHLKKLVARKEQFDCVLLDPPRQGLGKPSALLPLLRPRQIISISCDPATLARDLRLLTAGGYRLSQITPVDMFPQTHHIESIALLERN